MCDVRQNSKYFLVAIGSLILANLRPVHIIFNLTRKSCSFTGLINLNVDTIHFDNFTTGNFTNPFVTSIGPDVTEIVLSVNAFDIAESAGFDDSMKQILVDTLSKSIIPIAGLDRSTLATMDIVGNRSFKPTSMILDVNYTCNPNFYGSRCQNKCPKQLWYLCIDKSTDQWSCSNESITGQQCQLACTTYGQCSEAAEQKSMIFTADFSVRSKDQKCACILPLIITLSIMIVLVCAACVIIVTEKRVTCLSHNWKSRFILENNVYWTKIKRKYMRRYSQSYSNTMTTIA